MSTLQKEGSVPAQNPSLSASSSKKVETPPKSPQSSKFK